MPGRECAPSTLHKSGDTPAILLLPVKVQHKLCAMYIHGVDETTDNIRVRPMQRQRGELQVVQTGTGDIMPLQCDIVTGRKGISDVPTRDTESRGSRDTVQR